MLNLIKKPKTIILLVILLSVIIIALSKYSSAKNLNIFNGKEYKEKNILNQPSSSDNDIKSKEFVEGDGEETSKKNVLNDDDGYLRVHYINVGEGESILIEQGNETMLIDGGSKDDANQIIDYINRQQIGSLNVVIGTHPHADHIGGLADIIGNFSVSRVYMPKKSSNKKSYENLIVAISSKNIELKDGRVNESFNIGKAKCTIISPNIGEYDNINDYSIVIKLEYGNKVFLFTGDAKKNIESELINNDLIGKVDVLKVGNHGEKTSTGEYFLNHIKPEYAVMSIGSQNKRDYPSIETMDRLKKLKIPVYRTDQCGTIVATCDGEKINFNIKPGNYHAILNNKSKFESKP